ncbi:hypothetical protein ACH5RR_000030 [Cinchona calisaya]|uniref:Uncharacterized protein n=1 Tax=Cinchona calisaya TaxID=153742 RepID=A0ABD3AZL8_9GENT
MKMSELFRSKSCSLPRISAASSNSGILNSMSPSLYPHPHDDADNNEEQEEDDDDTEEEGYFGNHNKRSSSSPVTTPFIGLEERRQQQKQRSHSMNHHTHHHQFPPVLGIMVAALRKSLLVTCSVDTDDVATNNALDIGWPTDVRHVSHVTFDPFNGFLGLPLELQYHLPRKVPSASASVFGVSAQSMQCSYDHRGNSVPTILLMMQNRLYSEGGLQAEGIFRINAENSQEENVRNQLNKGVVPFGIDVHCLAGLIKAWFRELPTGVLDSLTPEQVMHCNTEEECVRLVNLLPRTEAALLDWGINLMADIVQHEHHNKMNARNIAMVFAPNMTQMADPLTALIHAVQVMNFLKTLIIKTLREREETASRISFISSTTHCPNHKEIYSSESGVLTQCHEVLDDHCRGGYSTGNLLINGTFDSLETDTRDNWTFRGENGARKENESVRSRKSPVMCKSQTMESSFEDGLEGEEVEEGILDKLNLRKGVRKLCRHPVFQLSKPAKKNANVGIVNSRGGGEAWV